MLVLGIDPGTATIGYGLVRTGGKKENELLDYGWIKTPKEMEHGVRLNNIFRDMSAILRQYSPDVVAIERLFFFMNAKTAMSVAQSTGVLMMAAARRKIPVFEYMPRQVKLKVAGDGRADKKKMQEVVRNTFSIRAPKKKRTHFNDVADAIAIALCHIEMSNGVK